VFAYWLALHVAAKSKLQQQNLVQFLWQFTGQYHAVMHGHAIVLTNQNLCATHEYSLRQTITNMNVKKTN